jgi:hypothetical protein
MRVSITDIASVAPFKLASFVVTNQSNLRRSTVLLLFWVKSGRLSLSDITSRLERYLSAGSFCELVRNARERRSTQWRVRSLSIRQPRWSGRLGRIGCVVSGRPKS